MKNTAIRDDLTVEKIAVKNLRIDPHLFREWQRKMAVIERVDFNVDSKKENPAPQKLQPIPFSTFKS